MKKSTSSPKTHASSVTAVKKNGGRPNSGTSRRLMVLAGAVILLAGLFYAKNNFLGVSKSKIQNEILPAAVKKVIGNDQTKFSINSLKKTNGLYEFELNLGEGQNARKYTSYITTDGKILFTSGIKVADLSKQAQADQPAPKKLTVNDLDKAENPKLTAFVVADCPFGLQMQRVFKKAVAESPAIASNLDVRYIGSVSEGKITSMHGDKEAQENLKQICLREEQPALYWPYVTCYMKADGKSEECSTTAGVDTAALKACVDDPKRGLAYAQKDFDMANKLAISSSPTLVLNAKQTVSEFDFGGRVANSLKTILCGSAADKLGFCANDLSKDEVAASFSADDVTAAQGSTAAQCGN